MIKEPVLIKRPVIKTGTYGHSWTQPDEVNYGKPKINREENRKENRGENRGENQKEERENRGNREQKRENREESGNDNNRETKRDENFRGEGASDQGWGSQAKG